MMLFCIASAFLSILLSTIAVYHGIRPGEPDQIGIPSRGMGPRRYINADKTGCADVAQKVDVMCFRHKAGRGTSWSAPPARTLAVRARASRQVRR